MKTKIKREVSRRVIARGTVSKCLWSFIYLIRILSFDFQRRRRVC